MLKTIFETVIDNCGLPVNFLTEYILLVIIGEVAYTVAFSVVGKYRMRRTEAKLAHWIIRLFVYLGLWIAVYVGIEVYFFLQENWKFILLGFAGTVGIILLAVIAVFTMRIVKKHRTVNGNA